MVRLKHANDEKSTTGGREFHTFITLSAKKLLHLLTYLLTYLIILTDVKGIHTDWMNE